MDPAQLQIRQPRTLPRPDPLGCAARLHEEAVLLPQQVWATLSSTQQAQIRQALRRVTQEVLHERLHF
jgi:hypothetical protein